MAPFDHSNFSVSEKAVSVSSEVYTSIKLSADEARGSGDLQNPYDGHLSEENRNAEDLSIEPSPEIVDNIPPSPFTLRASNCKKYQRPGRACKTLSEPAENNSHQPTNAASTQDKASTALSASSSAAAKTAAKPAGRGGGRVRDYTVLHPSCLSVCNVTIQDSIERGIDELATPAAPADLGEAGQMKKKSDPQPAKLAR